MKPSEARNLMPGDTIDYCVGPEWDEGQVLEVKAYRTGTTVTVRSLNGYGLEVLRSTDIISRTKASIAKPTPSIKACRDMTRGYLP